MAFTTQEGTGGAPWTFLGTPAADSIAVITGNTQNTEAFDFIAEGFEGNDTINFNGTRSVTIKGGQGADLITNNIAASAGLTSIISASFINGNDGDDRIGNTELGLLATLSTVSGGQGADKLYVGSLQSSKVNGNLGADFLEVGDITPDVIDGFDSISNFNAASIFGGQGDDAIRVRSIARAFTNSQVAGQDGNDAIQIQVGSFSLQAAIAANEDRGFDPDNGILTSPTTTGTTFDGGDGNDILDASALLLDIKQGGRVEIDANINNASGSDLDLFGGVGNDSMFGGVGEDLVDGEEGDDWLAGYGGRDEVVGGIGDDLIIGAYFDGELSVGFIGDAAGDTLSGGTGSNRFFVPGSASGRGVGASFFNTLGSTGNITVTSAGPSTTTNSVGVATISNGDFITVAFGADVITDWNAGAGNNVLDTSIGNNLQVGNAGAAQMSFGNLYGGTVGGVATGTQGNFAVRGFYTERFNDQGQFVVNQNGTDIAVWTNYTGGQFTQAGDVDSQQVFTSSVSNFTILKGVSTTVVVTANEFVAL